MLWEPRLTMTLGHFRVPSDGFHPLLLRNMPNSEYHATHAVSSGLMCAMDQSLAYTRWWIDQPAKKKGPALKLGSAVHAFVLGDDEKEKYVRLPELNLRREAERAERDWYYQTYGEEYCLSAADYELCEKLTERLWNHPQAKPFLSAMEERELSGFWTWDDCLGSPKLLNRVRFDGLCPSLGCALDLKTCQDASPTGFAQEIYDRMYYRQAAHYMAGAQALGLPIDRFIFIAVEKEEPFSVGVYPLAPRAIEKGMAERAQYLKRFNAALMTDFWPDYTEEDFLELDLPARAYL